MPSPQTALSNTLQVTGSHLLQETEAHNGGGDGGDGGDNGDAQVGAGAGAEAEAESESEADVFSPTDGYFRTASPSGWVLLSAPPLSSSTSAGTGAASSNVPFVPNIWVTDPSLEQGATAENKAREAAEETSNTSGRGNGPRFSSVCRRDNFLTPPLRLNHPMPIHYSTDVDRISYPSSSYNHVPENFYRDLSSTASYRPYAPRQPAYYRNDIPVEAPPAYTPSPTSPTSSGGSSNIFVRNYQTFSTNYTPAASSFGSISRMGRGEEAEGLLVHEPESMGIPNDGYDDVTPVWRERVRRRLPLFSFRTCKHVVIALALLLITTGFLTAFVTSVVSERRKDLTQKPVFDEDPGTSVPDHHHTLPDDDDDENSLHMDYPPIDNNDFSWGDHMCKNVVQRSEHQYDLAFGSGKSFTFIQDVENNNADHGRDIHVSGEVIVRRSGDGTPKPSLRVEVIANNDRIIPTAQLESSWDPSSQTMRITVPHQLSWDEADTRPCVNLQVTMWVAEDAQLDNLNVNSVHLDVLLMDNLSLQISQATNVGTTVGKIYGASNGTSGEAVERRLLENGAPDNYKLDSRTIEIKTTSGTIVGAWPLYDYLGLQSTSGDIRAGIDPKPASTDVPKPAYLYIKSLSGNVEFNEPIEAAMTVFEQNSVGIMPLTFGPNGVEHLTAERVLPPRDYRVNVQTTSGTIKGALAFSSQARFHSTSGDLTAQLLPVFDKSLADLGGAKPADLETSGTSAKTDLTILEPMWVDQTGDRKYISLPPSTSSTPSTTTTPAAQSPGATSTAAPIGGVGSKGTHSVPPGTGELKAASPAAVRRQPISNASAAMRGLYSRHTATSADIKVRYPASWEGTMAAGSTSGNIEFHGKGVTVTKSGEDWPGFNRRMEAYKGDDAENGGKIYAKVTSGKIAISVGQD